MKIYDCFMFFDEEMLLDFRLNYLNKYVDKFVIVESAFTHSGKKRSLLFDIENSKNIKKKLSILQLKKNLKIYKKFMKLITKIKKIKNTS